MGFFNSLFGNRGRVPCCYLCGKEGHIREIEFVEGGVFIDMRKWNKPWSPTQSCYQCGNCGRLVCYTHCDDRVPCECGEKNWITRSYIQKELDNG